MVLYSTHALKRMFQRGLSAAVVEQVLSTGQVIASYPDDTPYESRLILGFHGAQPVHVVAANAENSDTVVITAYVPDTSIWDSSFTRKLP